MGKMRGTGIFISYRRDDTTDEAKRLDAQLADLQGQVFRDVTAIHVAEKTLRERVAYMGAEFGSATMTS